MAKKTPSQIVGEFSSIRNRARNARNQKELKKLRKSARTTVRRAVSKGDKNTASVARKEFRETLSTIESRSSQVPN